MKTRKTIAFFLSFMIIMTSIVWFPQLKAVTVAEETEVLEQSVTLSEELPLICAEGLPAEITEANIQKYGHIQRIETTELNKIKFKNRDNTVSVYHFSENIRYEDANGVIRDKSNQLFLQSDGSYKNQYNDIQYTFPSGINKGVTLSYGNVSLVMTPEVQVQASKLPAVKYETDDASSFHKIVYENGFGTGKDIVYTPGYSGFKEDILLETPPTDSTFSFTVTVKNGSLNNREQFIEILDESSAVIGTIGSITVVSANNRFSDGIYSMQQYPGSIGQKTYRVTMELDESFLQSEDVVYPVTVDPSVTINSSSGSTKTIYDGILYESQTINTGTASQNIAGKMELDHYGYARSIMRFPTLRSDIEFCMIPNARLYNVILYMTCVQSTNSTTLYAYQYTGVENWTENSMTSGMSSSYSTSEIASGTISSGTSSSPQTYSLNITDIAKEWKKQPDYMNYGLLFKNSNETSSDYLVRFASSDAASNKPYLVYTYTPSTSFSIKNVYSRKFAAGVGSDGVDYIDGANTFIDRVFRQFGVRFTNSRVTQIESLVDQCDSDRDVPCNNACGTDCRNTHHRNVLKYSEYIENIGNAANQIYIAWDYASRNSLCYAEEGQAHESFSAMGCVAYATDSESRGILIPDVLADKYYDSMNVVMVFEPSLNFDSGYYASSMKLIAAHEMAHAMGILDTYENGADASHHWDNNQWTCIMKSFNHSPQALEFLTKIEEGDVEPFCNYCKNLIAKSIQLRYFPAS